MRIFRAAFDKGGSGPAAASVESTRRTRERRIVVLDGSLNM